MGLWAEGDKWEARKPLSPPPSTARPRGPNVCAHDGCGDMPPAQQCGRGTDAGKRLDGSL